MQAKSGGWKSISPSNDTTVESRALGLVSRLEAAFADYGAPLAQSLPMPPVRPRRRTSTSSVESLGVVGSWLQWMLRLLLVLIALHKANKNDAKISLRFQFVPTFVNPVTLVANPGGPQHPARAHG